MTDRRGPGPSDRDEPDFGWLYGGRANDPEGGGSGRPDDRGTGAARPPRDPDPTQLLPVMGRGGGPEKASGAYQPPPPPRDRTRRDRGGRDGGGRDRGGRDGGAGGPGGPRRRLTPPPGASGPPRRGRRRSRLRLVRYLLVLWLVFLVAVPLFAWSRITKVDATPAGDRPGGQPGTTYLLVGSDSREGLTAAERRRLGTGQAEGRRTDTIMLLHTGRGPNLLMSIPRDSIVDVPGHGSQKINAAFALGGPRLLVRTIEQNTGIRVDDYVEIGFAGFVDVVDAVGGVEICPTSRMRDPLANLDIEKGCQEVEGKVALGYARSRHTSGLGDITRAQHQREVVSAVGTKAASPWSVLNPVRYTRLALAGSRSLLVGEDTGPISTARFAWAMTRVNGTDGLTCGVPIADLAVNWDPQRSRRLFRLIAEDRTADVSKRLCRQSGLANQ